MDSKKQKKSRRNYDAAFKSEVVKIIAAGRSVPDIARSLGLGENLIYRLKKQAIETFESPVSKSESPQVSLAEHLALQKNLRELEMKQAV